MITTLNMSHLNCTSLPAPQGTTSTGRTWTNILLSVNSSVIWVSHYMYQILWFLQRSLDPWQSFPVLRRPSRTRVDSNPNCPPNHSMTAQIGKPDDNKDISYGEDNMSTVGWVRKKSNCKNSSCTSIFLIQGIYKALESWFQLDLKAPAFLTLKTKLT